MKWGGVQEGRLKKRAPINTQRMNIDPGRHTHQHQQHQLPEYVASSYTNTVYILRRCVLFQYNPSSLLLAKRTVLSVSGARR